MADDRGEGVRRRLRRRWRRLPWRTRRKIGEAVLVAVVVLAGVLLVTRVIVPMAG